MEKTRLGEKEMISQINIFTVVKKKSGQSFNIIYVFLKTEMTYGRK